MRRLHVGDRVVRVRDEGEPALGAGRPARAPLVCIHGAGSSSVTWMDVVRRIATRRRVVAPDLPGHGQSDRWWPPAEVSVDGYRDAVGTICAGLGIERAVLMGHSLGGLIALAAAAAWPERVAGVVLVNTGAKLPVSPKLFAQLHDDFGRFGKWFARLAWSPSTSIDTIERWGPLLLSADQETTIADFRAVERFDGEALLARVKAPALVLGGADDLAASPRLTEALGRGLVNAHTVVVPRAGHMLAQEQPDAFFAELEAFLVNV